MALPGDMTPEYRGLDDAYRHIMLFSCAYWRTLRCLAFSDQMARLLSFEHDVVLSAVSR